jgi:hypothetical protein
LGTEILGTLIAVYRFFIILVGGEYTLGVRVYALVWLRIEDAVEIWGYRMLREYAMYEHARPYIRRPP